MDIHSALLLAAVSGYGDVDADGYPSHAERDVHMWTNIVRSDPEAFRSDYGCWNEFESTEKKPKDILYYSRPLNESARYHSTDMHDENWFDHDSSPTGDHPFRGTDTWDRIGHFYTETSYLGENIAYGYSNGYDVMINGWMCSAGHRSNIMLDGYVELGTGVKSTYWTQNFSGGGADWDGPIAMGLHYPASADAGDDVEFYADYIGGGPSNMRVWVNGVSTELSLEWGADDNGVWTGVATGDEDCNEYWFEAVDHDGKWAFPEEGSYTYGDCDSDWVEGHMDLTETGDDGNGGNDNVPDIIEGLQNRNSDDAAISACSTTGSPKTTGFALLLAAGLLLRRRSSGR
ncbi:MAG: CAP domain-containing protein [Proteobacteria bacterium]|nr:CAP domain-containing protein [Pseudomonadota bacterium]MCP4920999.1 CAP domain-containing protein [Pseudomonadota bacterium]